MVDDPQVVTDARSAVMEPSSWMIFGRAMGVVLLGNLVLIGQAAIVVVSVLRETPASCGVDSCAFSGLAFFASE